MKLRKYLTTVSDKETFAKDCETSLGHLRNVAYGYSSCAPDLAVSIERVTHGAVTRPDMRPEDWPRIWPELIGVHSRIYSLWLDRCKQPTKEAA